MLNEYYFGMELDRPFSEKYILDRVADGSLRRLTFPFRLDVSRTLWLSPEGDVWLGRNMDPVRDPMRRRVERADLRLGEENAGAASEGGLWDTPVLQAISEHGKLRYQYGDYLCSHSGPAREFKPKWQGVLIDLLLGRLTTRLGKHVGRKHVPPLDEHRADYIEGMINLHELTLPLELMIEDPLRAVVFNVIQLGNVPAFAVVWKEGSQIETDLDLKRIDLGADWLTHSEFIQTVTDAEVQLCGHDRTVADSFLFQQILARRLDSRLRDSHPTVKGLAEWVGAESRGLAVCDIGIFYQMQNFLPGVKYVAVKYPTPKPIGLAYHAKDSQWGQMLQDAVFEVLASADPEIVASVEETKTRLEGVGAVWTFPSSPSHADAAT